MSPKRRQSKNASPKGGIATQNRHARPKSSVGDSANQWNGLKEKILAGECALSPAAVFGDSMRSGAAYRWGTASAFGGCDGDTFAFQLTRLASGLAVKGKQVSVDEFAAECRESRDRFGGGVGLLGEAWEALVWSASLPGLMHHLSEADWWAMLGSVQDYRDRILHSRTTPSVSLLGTVEIGLTLAWRLAALPSCRRLRKSSTKLLRDWIEDGDTSLSRVLSEPNQSRLVLASLIRCRMILAALGESGEVQWQSWRDPLDETVVELATWITAMTRRDGSSVFDPIGLDTREDGGSNGLLMRAGELEPESLQPAIKSAVGVTQTTGKLAWQVSLPESMLHDEDARLACLLPEWDVRRGRLFASYGQRNVQLELMAGRTVVLSGEMDTQIRVGGTPLSPTGDWVSTCEYSDDDVHYLEIEQPMTGGCVLQRQLMLIREDRCCLIADAVLRSSRASRPPEEAIEYQLSIPLAESIECQCEKETSELFLADEKRLAMVLPLSASEWRSGGTHTSLGTSNDGRLTLVARGRGQLYVPLWLDFTRSRFRKKRTWRQLTVSEQLASVPRRIAAAFRIQIGKEQWIWYRSMSEPVPRTFFGRHLIADFYGARFDAKSESFEDLITVDDDRTEDELEG